MHKGILLVAKDERELNILVALEVGDDVFGIAAGAGSENCDFFYHDLIVCYKTFFFSVKESKFYVKNCSKKLILCKIIV
jgi:hypothetical protein